MIIHRTLIWFFVVCVAAQFVLADPVVTFIAPTPDDAATIDTSSFTMKADITGVPNMKTMVKQWNGVDYLFYDSSLVGAWNFDNVAAIGDSSEQATDVSLSGNPGTVSGATYASGKYGNALSFDGVDDTVQIADDASLKPASVSVEAWFKGGAQGGYAYILAKQLGGASTSGSYGIYATSSGANLVFYVSDAPSSFTYSPDAGSAAWNNVWHHVVGTYDGEKIRLYFDGVEVGGGTDYVAPIAYNTEPLFIGTYDGAAYPFNGKIDEVRVWNRALTAAEVQHHYYSNLNKYSASAWTFIETEQGLVAGDYTYKVSVTDAEDVAANSGMRTLTSTYAPAVPEFSTYGFVLVILVSSIGVAFISRKTK